MKFFFLIDLLRRRYFKCLYILIFYFGLHSQYDVFHIFYIILFKLIDNVYILFIAETGPVLTHRRSWIENTNLSMKGSFTDLTNLDLDSDNSTPAMQRVGIL